MIDAQITEIRNKLESDTSHIEEPRQKIAAWNQCIESYLFRDYQVSKTLAEELLEKISDIPDDEPEKLRTQCMYAVALRLDSNFADALKISYQNLELVKKSGDRKTHGIILYEIASVLYELSEYQESMKYYLDAMKIFEDIDDIQMKSQTTISLGNLYSAIRKPRKAIELYRQALSMIEAQGDDRKTRVTRISINCNIASIYYDIDEYDKCISLSKELLDEMKEIPEPRVETVLLSNLARAYLCKGELEKARKIIDTCLENTDKYNFRAIKVGVLLSLANIHLFEDEDEAALSVLEEAKELAQQLKFKKRLADTYLIMANVYEERQDYKKAYEIYRLYHEIVTESINESAVNRMNTLKIIHDVESVRRQMAMLKEANARLEKEIAWRKKAEKELKLNEERFRLAKRSGHTGVWDWNIETGEFYLDPEIKEIIGYSDEEIPNRLDEILKFIHPDDRELVIQEARKHIQGKTEKYQVEHRMLHKDGSERWVFACGKAYFDASGKPVRMVGTDTDITEKKKIEAAYFETNAKLQAIFSSARDIIFMKDLSHNYVYFNPAMENILGSDFVLEFPVRDEQIFDVETAENHAMSDKIVYSGRTVEGVSTKRINNREYIFHTVKTPIRNEKGEIIGLCGIARDITEMKQAERRLKELNEELKKQNLELKLFRSAIEHSASIIFITDKKGNIRYVNPQFTKVTGYTIDEVRGKHPSILKSGYHGDAFYQSMRETILKGDIWRGILRNKRKDGSLYWEEIHVAPIQDEFGNIVHFVSISEDITQRIEFQKQLQESLAEKELLLKEIHHRVKNNLAIISSLLDLQASSISEMHVQNKFRECQSRIHTMALIHRNLYETEDLGRIDFRSYVLNLTDEIKMMFAPSARFNMQIENLSFSLDTAIPLGLILNELITNSIKHAFPDNRSGEITIRLKRLENGSIELLVKDNGVGFASDIDFFALDSLGMQLVINLAEQLEGNLKWSGENGAAFQLVFPENRNQ